MSNTNRHQNLLSGDGDSIDIKNNKELTEIVLKLLYHECPKNTYKSVANTLNVSLYIVRHWFQGNSNISAFYLYEMIIYYKSVRELLGLELKRKNPSLLFRKENQERNEKKLLQLLRDNPNLSVREMSFQLQMTAKSVEYLILKLKQRGTIAHFGSTKGGKWVHVKKCHDFRK